MKLALAALILGLATAAAAQSPTPPASKTPSCPDNPNSKTTWFDPNQYLPYGSGIEPAHAVSVPDPDYPESARNAKINGTVELAVAINARGTVDDVKVVCKLQPSLDQSAANAVKQWKFTPATKDGEPVPFQARVAVEFRTH